MSFDGVRRVVLILGAGLIVTAILFPPWVHTQVKPGMAVVTAPAGHSFVLSPPNTQNSRRRLDARHDEFHGVRPDYTLHAFTLAGLITTLILLNVALRRRVPTRAENQPQNQVTLLKPKAPQRRKLRLEQPVEALSRFQTFLSSRLQAGHSALSHDGRRDYQKAELAELKVIIEAFDRIRRDCDC